MIRRLSLLLLITPALLFAACGGGKTPTSAWEEDTDLISDEGDASMVSIPAGEGMVGIKDSRVLKSVPKKKMNSTKFRSMTFKAFKMDKYEVTLGNYYTFLQTRDEDERTQWRPRHHLKGIAHDYWSKGHYKSGKGNYPVTGIPYEAAEAYAEWRGKRLPFEFEWEYAARGKQGYKFSASSNSYNPSKYNVSDSWDESPKLVAVDDPKNAADVGPFQCVGMGGNASEWCDSKQIREFNVRNAETGKIIKGERQKFRIKGIRGPNFTSAGDPQCLLSNQGYRTPKPKLRSDRLQLTLGFRCAK